MKSYCLFCQVPEQDSSICEGHPNLWLGALAQAHLYYWLKLERWAVNGKG